jgi:hypothetical protein
MLSHDSNVHKNVIVFFYLSLQLIKDSMGLKMKKLFRTVFLFLMLAVFIIGTTGISFYIHECSSSKNREIIAFPELLNKTVSCGCAGEVYRSVPSEEPVSSFSEPECCKNIHIYLKASFTGFPQFYHFNPELLQTVVPADLLSLQHNEKLAEISTFTPRVDHPPPRSGKILVHFLQQIKIPAPVS